MSKKVTKQSRATKRRKARQAETKAALEKQKASAFSGRRQVPLHGMELAAVAAALMLPRRY